MNTNTEINRNSENERATECSQLIVRVGKAMTEKQSFVATSLLYQQPM